MKKHFIKGALISSLLLTSNAVLIDPVNAQVQTSSQVTFQQAYKQGEVFSEKILTYYRAVEAGDIEKINHLYDDFTSDLKKIEQTIGKVPGYQNRKNLQRWFVHPAKVDIERTIYEVSQYRLLDKVTDKVEADQLEAAESLLDKLDRLKKRGKEIKQTTGYKSLPRQIYNDLYLKETVTQGHLVTAYTKKYKTIIDSGNLPLLNDSFLQLRSSMKQMDLLIGQIPNADTRKKFGEEIVRPAKLQLERTRYEISQYQLMETIKNDLITNGSKEQYEEQMAMLQRLKARTEEKNQSGTYEAVPQIEKALRKYEQTLQATE
ncbi:hypothetical protein KDJ21_008490 [Metabacillus litoralis]|uniref:hypothetical protein n=1 Tax=Metabacillus TaxID=2675233 RepID=UPI001B9D5A11|nr:hypothetical protein [Metabacillus litoralis]MCM3410261.1 hypothetical protein [Metabacillus litoralis]UHA61667.1 hypothetical protein KDJ21_008490 [Metabacillus litoralis]